MTHRKLAGAVLALATIGLGLLVASPASANHNVPVVSYEKGDCGEVTLAAAWITDTHVVGNATLVVDDGAEVKTAAVGEPVTVGPFGAGWHTIHYRVFGGGERDYDVPQWTESGKDAINKWAADNDGWWWTTAGVEVTAPFVTWQKLRVRGCATESAVTFTPDCDGTTVDVASGTFYGSYEWTATWADGAESASLTLAGGEVGQLATVPADGGEIVVDFGGSPAGWPQSYTYDPEGVDGGCADPEPTPTVEPTTEPTTDPTEPPGVGGGTDAQLPVTGASWVPVAVGVGAVSVVTGVALMRALRRRTRPVFTLPG